MVTNRYKSSPAVARGTRTKFGARFRLFTTIHSGAVIVHLWDVCRPFCTLMWN